MVVVLESHSDTKYIINRSNFSKFYKEPSVLSSVPGRLRHSFDMQNAGEFGLVPASEMLTAFRPMLIPPLDPISHLSLTLPFSIPQTVASSLSSPSNHITGVKDHTSTQADMAS